MTLCLCAVASIAALDRLCLFHQTYQAISARLSSERWLLEKCSDPNFFSNMHQHSDLCFQVSAPPPACVDPLQGADACSRRSRTTPVWEPLCWPCGRPPSPHCPQTWCRAWPQPGRCRGPSRGSLLASSSLRRPGLLAVGVPDAGRTTGSRGTARTCEPLLVMAYLRVGSAGAVDTLS